MKRSIYRIIGPDWPYVWDFPHKARECCGAKGHPKGERGYVCFCDDPFDRFYKPVRMMKGAVWHGNKDLPWYCDCPWDVLKQTDFQLSQCHYDSFMVGMISRILEDRWFFGEEGGPQV